jgi:PAS domain S-box-containing protein
MSLPDSSATLPGLAARHIPLLLQQLAEAEARLQNAQAAAAPAPAAEAGSDGPAALAALLAQARVALLDAEQETAARRDAENVVQQTERRFRALIEHSADAVSLLTPQGVLTYASPAAVGVLGYPVEDLMGRNVFELVHPDDLPRISVILARLLESAGATATAEYRMRHRDGSWRWIEGTGTNLLEEPAVQAIVANYRDITERHQAEEKLAAQHEEIRATTQQLWQAAKLATMGELVAGIAHELNNPLATISLRLEAVLAQLPEGDPRRRPLEVVQQEAERMATLVASLLQLGRRGQPQISTLDVPAELSKALELMHYHLAQRQISLETDFDPQAPRVLADRQQLRQVFLNLLTNAADAMPQGGRLAVRVAGGSGGPEGLGTVTVEVADTGGGISPEILAHVWEPFFTTKVEGKGTGLGLSICRHILQEHGATIELDSRPGQGTTARVRLPIQPPDRSSHSARLQAEGPPA